MRRRENEAACVYINYDGAEDSKHTDRCYKTIRIRSEDKRLNSQRYIIYKNNVYNIEE